MPGIAIQPYDIQNKTVNNAGDDEHRQRVKRLDMLLHYYHGMHPKPLKVRVGEYDDNVIFNAAGQVINSLVQFIGVPSLQVGGQIERERDPQTGRLVDVVSDEQQAVDAFWDRNDLPSFLPDMALSLLVSGHCYLRLAETPDGPTVHHIDPRKVTVFWNASDVRKALFYRVDWRVGDTRYRQDILPDWMLTDDIDPFMPPPPESWVIREYMMGRGQRWELRGEDRWSYPFAPIVDLKNESRLFQYYGGSDIGDDIIGVNNALNFVASNTARIIKHHAHPKTIVSGADLDEMDASVDSVITFRSKDVTVNNLEMRGDLRSSMEMMDRLRAALFSQASVVDVSSHRDKLGQMTNFGVRVLFGDQLNKVETKRQRIGKALIEVTRRALEMQGLMLETAPKCVWPDALPTNRKELVETAQMELDTGLVSGQSVLEDLGRDMQTEQERLEDEENLVQQQLPGFLSRAGERGRLL